MDGNNAVGYITQWDWQESKLGLERVNELLERLGNPEKSLRFVHVAGTNGKGSVCSMLSSVISAAGYRTGLYTSPFINDFNERIQIDGVPIPYDDLADVTTRVQFEADQMEDHPTEFELITCIAFLYFYETRCDIIVLEVGLGGRLDATNAIPAPEVAVITPVSYDHTQELGDTIAKIAWEKAGIIKPGCAVVTSPQLPEAAYSIRKRCRATGSRMTVVEPGKISIDESSLDGQSFSYKGRRGMRINLLGAYQTQNAAVVMTVSDVLRRNGWSISNHALRRGLAAAAWPARFEILHRKPWFIVDGGHNPQCVDSLVDNLNTYFPGKKITFITGVMADKDFEEMFGKIVPLAKRVFTVTPNNPRALDAVELAKFFFKKGVQYVKPCGSIEEGIGAALQGIDEQKVICAFGSFYMAGDIRRMFGID